MEEETGVIQLYYDGWHLVKWLGNELLKVSKKRGCAPVSWWIENTKTHCWNAIAVGALSLLDIPPMSNTCLMHVRDVHEWQEEGITGPYKCCSHDELVGPRPETLPLDSNAYQAFRKIVLTNSFQRDLAKASPYGGTSICETNHALEPLWLYCRKEIFYPVSTYHLYVKLATIHINTLRLAEMAGERKF
ncbi:hypothetical protein ANCCAN_22918 [Ancylostoma caninum]|uniref:Uncharacterized protein n=1 Tax=Ancylostoma caninum TaxID=29170 RepID=A0A368FGP0_ANCCA|nr:hypothetical protein ANCCAN_22918 [Ancylostoma caninum]